MLTGLAAGTLRAQQAAAAAAGTVVFGPKCPDVMVIAARGAGEPPQEGASKPPQEGWTDPKAYRDPKTSFGAGEVNLDLFQKLENAAPRLHFSLDPVMYPAVNAWNALDTWRKVSYFDASVESGATTVVSDIERTERGCGGGVKYLLSGYSEGAWVVHRALRQLASGGSKRLISKIVGVAMFGDPKFAPHDEIVRDTKLLLPYYGVLTAGGIDLRDADVPKNLRQITASYCFTFDPICQGPPKPSWLGEMPECVVEAIHPLPFPVCKHYRYILDGKTAKAAKFLTPKLPAKSVWPRLTGSKPPRGRVGAPYQWRATATPTARTTYKWTALSAPPPGLEFSDSGMLSGTPTTPGTYKVRIKAQSVPQERYVTGTVTVTIDQGTSPPPACSSGTCTAVGWGANESGQLGDGTTTNASTPVPVRGLTGVTAVAAGADNSLALRNDGTVWAWGSNSLGQLGDPAIALTSSPVQVPGLTGVTAVAIGGAHSLAVRDDGTVWAWGFNSAGQLGDGTTTQASSPVQVQGLTRVTAIAAGDSHNLALRNDGTVWAWGWNGAGQLGDGTTTNSSTPVQVGGLTGVTAVAAGTYHSLAVRDDGTVWAWGGGSWGQLGDGASTQANSPVQVSGLTGVTAIAAGDFHSLAVRSDGTASAWGGGWWGQLGDGTTTQANSPVQVSGLTRVTAVAGGYGHSLAVRDDGTVWAWGSNSAGQLGNPTITQATTPVQVSGLTGVNAVTAGEVFSLALRS